MIDYTPKEHGWAMVTISNGTAEIAFVASHLHDNMEITQALKTEIYYALTDFLEAYKAEDTQVLAEKFDFSGEFLEEIYEILGFVEDKSVLHLFPIEEMDKKEGRSTTGKEN